MKRQNGSIEVVEPWRVTEDFGSNPFMSLAYPRPDFNGALLEFFIGLLSTMGLAESEEEWIELWENPPDPEDILERLEPLESAFWLDSTQHRFMQDEDLLADAKPKPVHSLLIDAPGSQTLKHNADHFVKRNAVTQLSRAAAAAALYTLNTYAPSGGVGHRTSLRGGGPLTTLAILEDHRARTTMWSRIWPNVETKEQVLSRGEIGHDTIRLDSADFAKIFPWMGSTRISTKDRSTLPKDIHPLHVYWGMPRRIRLELSPRPVNSSCAIFGDGDDDRCVTQYRTLNYGFNYQMCIHPLSPYYEKKSKGATLKLPQHPQLGGFSYRQWPGVVFDNSHEGRFPANAIRYVQQRHETMRVVAYGFNMDNMKARAWIQSEWPVHIGNSDLVNDLADFVELIVTAAERISQILISTVRNSVYDQVKAPTGSFAFVAERFFRNTEQCFYETYSSAVAALMDTSLKDVEIRMKTKPIRQNWVKQVGLHALEIFDEHVSLDQVSYARIGMQARQRFLLHLAVNGLGKTGKALYSTLDISTPNTEKRQ